MLIHSSEILVHTDMTEYVAEQEMMQSAVQSEICLMLRMCYVLSENILHSLTVMNAYLRYCCLSII